MTPYIWNTKNLPKPENRINFYCRLMNSFSLLPSPFNKIALVFKPMVKKKLIVKKFILILGAIYFLVI